MTRRGLGAGAGALAALLALAACGGPGRRVVHDLVAELPLAEADREVGVVDVGSQAARSHLVSGWYGDESASDGTGFAWSRGTSPTVVFYLQAPRDLAAHLRCRPLAAPARSRQTITPVVNGRILSTIALDPGFRVYPLPLPAAALRAGSNRLELRARFAASPRELGAGGDWRRLAVAVDWLRLDDAGDAPPPAADPAGRALLLPARTEVAYLLRLEEGLELALDGVEAASDGGGHLECVAATDEDGEVARASLEPGEGPLHLPIPGPAGRPLRLTLRALPAGGGAGGALRVLAPRLTALVGRAGGGEVAPVRPPRAGPVNVVLYLVDALRADRLGVYGCDRPTSPALDAFTARATVFERAWAQSSWTRPAVASLFTGLRPEVHGVNGRRDRLGEGPPVLAELLRDAGYDTAAVVANPNVAAELGFGRGFDTFELEPWDRRRSGELNRVALDWLDRRRSGRPFLLYVHTVDPHLPYEPPPDERARFAAGVDPGLGSTATVGTLAARDMDDEGRYAAGLRDLYDAEVAANDRSFGELVTALADRSLLDDSLVVFLSDHGEELFDHGDWIHGRTLYQEVLRVPLVVKLPRQRSGQRVAAPVQQIDLLPTVLGVLGLKAPAGLGGRNILGELPDDRPAAAFLDVDEWRAGAALRGDLAALRHCRLGGCSPPELYDLASDPGEHHDLGPGRPILAATLLVEARAAVLGEEGRYRAGEAVIPVELRRRLEALGYVSAGR